MGCRTGRSKNKRNTRRKAEKNTDNICRLSWIKKHLREKSIFSARVIYSFMLIRSCFVRFNHIARPLERGCFTEIIENLNEPQKKTIIKWWFHANSSMNATFDEKTVIYTASLLIECGVRYRYQTQLQILN